MLSLILHELATNALKYGALSNASGRIDIDWYSDDGGALVLVWRERGGPPVEQSERKGFGSRLITSSLASSGGSAEMTFEPSGVVCTIRCPTEAK
jgi:two-component sensor histidine kinase